MFRAASNIRLVSRSIIQSPVAVPVCGSCGDTAQSAGVCRRCALLLVDLALSSVANEFPKVVEESLSRADVALSILPKRYGHYEVCTAVEGGPWELGRGAMGITYKAIDTHLGCTVALKVINSTQITGEQGRQRFLREARTAAALKHPNIASIYHLGLGEDDQCFYAMEYIAGETLEQSVLRKGPLPCGLALNVVAQAAWALRTAHQQQFIHRDIKPTNLMLISGEQVGTVHDRKVPENVVVKLIDFGLVKAIGEEEGLGWTTLCRGYFAGTPIYAAPEQLASGKADVRTDIYALGRCLWFMLTGEPPPILATGAADQPAICLEASNRTADQRLKQVPQSVQALVQAMVAHQPEERPQSAAELLQRIEKCRAAFYPSERRRPQTIGMMLLVGLVVLGAWACKLALTERIMPAHPQRTAAQLEARVLSVQGNEHRYKFTRADNLQAIELQTRAIALDPNFADAHAALACAYLQGFDRFGAPANQRDAALASAQRAIAIDSNSPAGFTALAEIRTVEGMHWAALNEYHQALERDPHYLPAMRGFSLLWSTVGQPQRGLPWALAATKIDPGHLSGWNAAADASVDLCDDEQAEQCYQRCLKINPAWVSGHSGLLHLHLLQGNFEQARQDAAVIDSIDPHLILPLTLKAQIALFSHEYAEAEVLYLRLLDLNRNGQIHYYGSISYLSALGFLRHQAGDQAGAEVFLKEAEELHLKDSEGPQSIYDLAAIRSIQGRQKDALSLLEQAITSGWMDYRTTWLDPRFSALRDDASFGRILHELSVHVEKMKNESEVLCVKPLSLADYPIAPPSK